MATREIHLTKEQIDAMDPDELNELLLKAVKIEGTAVVRRADGSIKYDNPPGDAHGSDQA